MRHFPQGAQAMKPDEKSPASERDAVKRNFENATKKEPGEFKDESNERKVVEIGPELTDEPIKGIDP